MSDWTAKDGHSNSSERFLELCKEVERLIRADAHKLISGRADMTARLIVAQLAHKHNVGPLGQDHSEIRKGDCSGCGAPSVLNEDDLCNDCSNPK